MEYGPPPLFNQGVPARARLAFFALLAALLLAVDARYRALDTLRLGVGVALYPLQQALLVPRDLMRRFGDYAATIDRLQRDNAALRVDAVLRARDVQAARQLAEENAQLRRLLGARERIGYDPLLVEVAYESRDRFTRKLVVDRGERDGLRPGMPAIDERGVVGQLTRVLPASAELTLLTDREQAIPVQIARNGLRGVAFGGQEAGTLDLRFLPVNADVVNGDEAYTSGLDGVYPAGLRVATVARVERDAKDAFARIVLQPAAGVQQHLHLLVLRGAPRPVEVPAPAPAPAARPRLKAPR